jgi:MATE family multidrug resistance protein
VSAEDKTTPEDIRDSGVREILWLAFPIIVAMASSTLMGFVDFWMVSHVGVDEAAAVSPAGIVVFTFISFFSGILSCTNTFVSQSFAKRDYGECSRYVWQGLYIALLAGVGSLFLWPLAPRLFAMLGHEPKVQVLETAYFQSRLPSVWSMTAVTSMTGFFQGIGRPRLSMAVAIVANVLNVFLNWVLIYGHLGSPAMGIFGAGLATSIAAGVQAAILVGLFLSGEYARDYHSRRLWQLDGHRLAGLLHIGWPAGVSWTLDVGTWGIFIAVIVGSLGKTALAASNMAGQILHMSFMPTIGLSIATTVLVGQNIGRGEFGTTRARARTALLMGMGYMFLMGVVFFVFREPLIRLFLGTAKTAEDLAAHVQIVGLGAKILILAAIFQVFDAMGIVTSGALKGAGDTRFPMLITVIYGLALFLPLCYLFTYVMHLGVVGAWGGATVYICALGLTLLWRWRGRAWESIDIFRKKPFKPEQLTERITPYEPGEEIPGS